MSLKKSSVIPESMLDYNNQTIKPGVLVAYNRSGEVRIGEVKQISKTQHRYRTFPLIIVYDIVSGLDSRISSNKNLCVLPCQSCLRGKNVSAT